MLRCKHKWEMIDKTILPSAYEQITEEHNVKNIKTADLEYFQKKLVYIFQCTNPDCKKIRKIVETNP